MKTTANKTIPFKQRGEEKKVSKYYKINTKNKTLSTNKVIPYPKYRKKKKNGAKFVKHNKPLLIVAIIAFALSLMSFINRESKLNDNGLNSKHTLSNSTTSKRVLTPAEFKNTSKIVSLQVQNALKLSSNSEVSTKTMHRNGTSIYAQGSVEVPSKGELYFDILLKNNIASSLVINGTEYMKK
ncbi:hypothetical protein [Romboutsia sp.]|uniref:hypothetical protein n=1 Tax=Romboutsia sp. TaxID=1965302 RepID=UPI003F2FE401